MFLITYRFPTVAHRESLVARPRINLNLQIGLFEILALVFLLQLQNHLSLRVIFTSLKLGVDLKACHIIEVLLNLFQQHLLVIVKPKGLVAIARLEQGHIL